MLTFGHIAVSYLIAEGAKSYGIPLSTQETLGLIAIGNIPDVDFLTGFITGKKGEAHHQNITHTPLGILIIWTIVSLLFSLSPSLSLLVLLVLLIHLVLDDIGHWIYKLKLHSFPVGPQINWLYPFTKYSSHQMVEGTSEVLRTYLFKAWPVSVMELIFTVTAIIVFAVNFK